MLRPRQTSGLRPAFVPTKLSELGWIEDRGIERQLSKINVLSSVTTIIGVANYQSIRARLYFASIYLP